MKNSSYKKSYTYTCPIRGEVTQEVTVDVHNSRKDPTLLDVQNKKNNKKSSKQPTSFKDYTHSQEDA